MKRDMDLYRKILIEVESWSTTSRPKQVAIDGYSDDTVGHHAWLLHEAGLIEGLKLPVGTLCRPKCLTYQGHDFLEHARNDTRWQRAKDFIANNGGPMTVQLMKTTLEALTKVDWDALTKGGMGGP